MSEGKKNIIGMLLEEYDIRYHRPPSSADRGLAETSSGRGLSHCIYWCCTFFCTRNNKYYKWYYTDKGKTKYIPKSERKLAEQLVKRKYLESRLRKFKQEEKRIDIYLKQYSLDEFSSYHVEEHPELQKLLSGVYVPLKQELDEWVNASYTNNPKEPQKLIHKTIPGILVRSKSEALIINALFGHKIPFRYECLLQIQNVSIYPDFTIRHPVTGEVYYWEHFGMIDNENYAHNVYSKLQL